MLINEVCYKVGMTRKTIRYYEEEGLLNPIRNKGNDYREYNEEDVLKLRKVKFLRELNVPVNDIRRMFDNELSLKDCMNERLYKIDNEINDYQKIKNVCEELIRNDADLNNVDISKYYQEMNILNKKGVTMRNVKTSNKSKINGACISSLAFSTLFIFLICMITYFQVTEDEKLPWVFFIFFIIILAFPIIGIIYNLIVRIKEIKGGEEDEASKY